MVKEIPSYLRIAKLFELMNDPRESALERVKDVAVNDSCPLVQHEAIFALGEMASSEIVSFLKDIASSGAHYAVIHEALVSIGTLGSNNDLEFLEKFKQSNDYNISCSAKVAIGRINQTEDIPRLFKENKNKYIEELFDYEKSNHNRRVQILFQLMLDSRADSIAAIHKCLKNDPCPIVRHEAGFTLGEIDNAVVVEYMGDALKTETAPIVIHEILFALGTTGKKEALPIIEKFLDNTDYVISESAKIARDRILYLDEPYSGARHFA